MFNYYEIFPAYHHIYLKNLSMNSEDMIDINTINFASGYAASNKEIAVFTQDTDLTFANRKPVKVFVASEFISHPADEGMIMIYSGKIFCASGKLVLCNPLTVNTTEAVTVNMEEYKDVDVDVDVYVDNVGNAEHVVFCLT